MSTPAATATVGRSIGDVAAAAACLIEQCVKGAVAELQARETQAAAEQRQQLAAAWRALMARSGACTEHFPGLLRAALAAEVEGAPGPESGPTAAPADFLSLGLVDETEITRKLESTRLAQQLTAMLERPLAELDPLMSTALGLDGIQPQRNPLRPAVYAQVLRQLLEQDRPEPGWTALWLRAMVQPLAQGLEQLYRTQAALLQDAQVPAADYRVVTAAASAVAPMAVTPDASPAAPAPRRIFMAPAASDAAETEAAAAAAAAASPSSTPAPSKPVEGPAAASAPAVSALLTAESIPAARLQQFLLGDAPDVHEPPGAAFVAHAQAELQALQEQADTRSYDEAAAQQHRALPPLDRPMRPVATDTPLPARTWGDYAAPRERSLVRGRLKAQARELGQVFGVEVVHQLLGQVAEDPRLLAPVREAFVALEPALARLAMVAPRFFGDEQHPGRLLVERVAGRSFRYNDEFSPAFEAFLAPVVQTFARLNDIEPFRTATPFQAALAALQAEWSAQDAREREVPRKVLQTVQFAERRQQEAQALGARLRERDDLLDAPLAVQEFALGPWALVVAHARLTQPDAGADPGGHLAVLADLLWTVHREHPLHDPARAFALIPKVLPRLREGLASLGQQPADSEAFFHALELLHRPVLRLRARQRHRELAPPEAPPARAASAPAPPPEQPWMPPEELHAAGFEETQPAWTGTPAAARPSAAQPLPEQSAEACVAALHPGCWVDLHARGAWRRAQLAWAAEKGTLFMFVSDGGQAHSMTRRSLQRLARDQLLRLVAAEGVVPRALQRLAAALAAAA